MGDTLLPKAALQPAVLLKPLGSRKPERTATPPRQQAERLPHTQERVSTAAAPAPPKAAEPIAQRAEPQTQSAGVPSAEYAWVQDLPPQSSPVAQPAPKQSGAAGTGMADLEASVRTDLVRLRARAQQYLAVVRPKLSLIKFGKFRRLQWVTGLALLLFFTPVGDYAWASVEEGLVRVGDQTRSRAAFQFIEDFRQGILADWDADGLTTDEETRTARAGDLTLHEGTMDLTDYFMDVEFTLDRPSLGWAVRAQDHHSYCSFEIRRAGTKANPRYLFVRVPIIGGKPDERDRVEIDVTTDYDEAARNRISIRIRGERVTTFLNGRSVDFWTDKVLGTGGIGFWSSDGPSAQIQRVAVYGNEDFWGLALYAAREATSRVKEFFAATGATASESRASF